MDDPFHPSLPRYWLVGHLDGALGFPSFQTVNQLIEEDPKLWWTREGPTTPTPFTTSTTSTISTTTNTTSKPAALPLCNTCIANPKYGHTIYDAHCKKFSGFDCPSPVCKILQKENCSMPKTHRHPRRRKSRRRFRG